jgi:hypothetical protein
MEVTYSVTEAQGMGDGYLNGMDYREIFTPGDLDFFITDSANYTLFTGDSAFEAFEIGLDSTSGDVSFMPPDVTDDWYAVWSDKAVMNFSQVVDATARLYSNNGTIAPVCHLRVDRGGAGEAILDWEDLVSINMEAYNVYRSTSALDVGHNRPQGDLAPFQIGTAYDSTYTDSEVGPPVGVVWYYTVRTLGKSGALADDCVY